jgi:hypothetical protein
MNKSVFSQYLNNIDNAKTINYPLFLQSAQLHSISETQLDKIFSKVKVRGNRYQLTIIDPQKFTHLQQQFLSKAPTNRVEASLVGNSHLQRVGGSLMTILFYQQAFPQVLVFDKNAHFDALYKPYKNLLIIENLENFLAIIKNQDYLTQWLDKHWDCDIVYASGNAINNKLHHKFFAHYDRIRCLLDIDMGGLKIFKSFSLLVSQTSSCEFVLSDYYIERYKQFGITYSNQDYIKLLNFKCPPSLVDVYNMVVKNKKFVEQELLLKL